MSGGTFDYQNLDDAINKIVFELEWHSKNYNSVTIKELKKSLDIFSLANIYLHRADWLLAGDDSEETFNKELKEDLSKYKSPKIVKKTIECSKCESYNEYTHKCKYDFHNDTKSIKNCYDFYPKQNDD